MKNRFILFLIMLISLNTVSIAQESKLEDDVEKEETENTIAIDNPEYSVQPLRITDSIYMFKGKGGNVGVFVGKEGALVIDSQFDKSAPKIFDMVSRFSDKDIKLLINTHHHGDHTGGNSYMHNRDILTIAQKNVRELMLANERAKIQDELDRRFLEVFEQAKAKGATEEVATDEAKRELQNFEKREIQLPNLPKIVFERELNLYFEEEDIRVFHINNAHTNGDAVVYFTSSNVMHTGDAFVNGKYPFIDQKNGGTYRGYLAGLQKLLMLVNEDTKIIPGHGDLATKKDLKYAESMMRFIIPRIQYHVVDGRTLEEVLALKETKEYDAKGFGDGFISTKKFVTDLYNFFKESYGNKARDNK